MLLVAEGSAVTTEENKALVRQVIEAHNRQDWQATVACFSPDASNHGRRVGREGIARVFQSLYAAFPDFHFELDLLLTDGDWVVAYQTMSGTHRGSPHLPVLGGLLSDVPPTGKRVAVPNIHCYRIENGLIAEHRAVRDDLGMMQQLGLLPTTTHSAGDISRPAR
jgi:predicted ester cyclase